MTLLILAAVLTPAGYLLSCRLFPYTRCDRCEGSGRRGGSNRARWGLCKKCGGTGRRERIGVRLLRGRRDR